MQVAEIAEQLDKHKKSVEKFGVFYYHGGLGRQLRATPAKLHGCNQRGTLGAQERNVEDEFASDVEVLEVENEVATQSENSEDSQDESV